ncbi:hypothetical protein EG68_07444 [Paragonimus skrjabini miyazakii]|uniref:Uncharacterized protein n=1 Tax=Paragonimus skrjabini miyazakii TaxID=59628 RepID=A0A8S9YPG0_9TREM|nr:hypothetical protein EG68_07444 [Paragonimus skrjabini miyazakii]
MTFKLTPTDLSLDNLREELTRERTNIQSLKAELEQLKGRETPSTGVKNALETNAEYQKNLVQNLEAQIETLKEELDAEFQLRMKFEEELNRVQEQLRSCRGLSAEEHIQELKEYYDRELRKSVEDYSYIPIKRIMSPESNRGSQNSQMFPTSDIGNEAEFLPTPAEMKGLKEELAKTRLSYETVCPRVLDLEAKLTDMEGKYEASCRMVNEAFQKVAETLELAKQTADERDAAIIEQADTARELEQLRSLVEKLADEAGKRAREEVDKVRDQANTNISKLLQNLHVVEKERTQLQMELDHVRSGLEHDLRITRDLDSQTEGQLDLRFEHVLQRAHQAEGERDELKLKLETCQLAHERAISCKQQEIEHLLDEQRALKNRLDNAETLRSSVEERLRQQVNAMHTIEQQSIEAKRQSETSQRSALQQVLLAHQAAELREAECKRRIEVLEKTSQQSLQGWREVLKKQQLLVERWKSEAHTLADQLEQQGISLRAEVDRYKAKALQAEKRLEQLEHKKHGLPRKRNW